MDDETEGRRACSAPVDSGLGPGRDPRRFSVAAAITPLIDPLLSLGPLATDPRLAGDGVGVASKDPLRAPLAAPAIVGCDNFLSPGK